MKKTLLLGFSVLIGISAIAQGKFRKATANTVKMKAKTFVNRIDDKPIAVPKKSLIPSVNNITPKPNSTIYPRISSSYNLLTALVSQSNALNYNKDLNVVTYVHRQSMDWPISGANSGNTQVSWTTDNGATWDSLIFGLCNGGNINYRYPSGGLLNPPGNTVLGNAVIAGSGPITNGSGWKGNYYVSAQLNKNNVTSQDMLNGAGLWPTHHYARVDFDVFGSQAKVASSLMSNPDGTTAAAQAYRGMAVATGVYDTTAFDFTWTFDTINVVNMVQSNTSAEPYLVSLGFQTWDDSARIGYYMFLGIDTAARLPGARSYQPIVFKTTNGGTSWSQYKPGFDWSSLAGLQPYLVSYDGVHAKPFFTTSNGNDMAVDKNGDLHIACQIYSGSSDYQDGLDSIFGTSNYIFDAYTTPSGWDITIIDSIIANASAGEGSVPWVDGSTIYDVDARLQISKSADRDKLFFVWADSYEDASWPGTDNINMFPSLYSKGIDVDTRCFTQKKSVSTSLDYTWFHYTSVNAITNLSTGLYTIPCTYVNSNDGSYNAIARVDHYYIDNLQFTTSDFTFCGVGINEQEANLTSVSVFPNPFNNNATVSVKTKESGELKLNVYNAWGQLVLSQKAKAEAGLNTINISAENLSSGIYFYEVRIGGSVVTNKMVIQK